MQSNHEDADIENKLMDRGGGEGERKGESSMDACTVIYGNRWPVGNLLYHSGNSNWGSVITERGGNGGRVGGRLTREGTYVHLWLIHAADGRNQTNIVKQSLVN